MKPLIYSEQLLNRKPWLSICFSLFILIPFIMISSPAKNINNLINEISSKNQFGLHLSNILTEYCQSHSLSPNCEEEGQQAALNILGKTSIKKLTSVQIQMVELFDQPELNFSKEKSYSTFINVWTKEKEDVNSFAQRASLLIGNNWSLFAILLSFLLHGFLAHAAFNIFFVLISGFYLEKRMNRFLLLFLYLGSGVLSSIIFVHFFQRPLWSTIGASAAVNGLLGSFLFLFTKEIIRIKFKFSPKLIGLSLFYIFCLSDFINSFSHFLKDPQTSETIHFFSYIIGLLLTAMVFVLQKKFISKNLTDSQSSI